VEPSVKTTREVNQWERQTICLYSLLFNAYLGSFPPRRWEGQWPVARNPRSRVKRRSFGEPANKSTFLLRCRCLKTCNSSSAKLEPKLHRRSTPLLFFFYWQVGHRIRSEILKSQRAEYGEAVIPKLAEHLTAEFGNGFSRPNLFRMLRFAEVFPDQ